MRAVQVAENESRFRTVNERLLAAEAALAADELFGFVCECGYRAGGATESEYRQVRVVLVHGHARPEFEEVIGRDDRFMVVRRFGAGQLAEQRDPNA